MNADIVLGMALQAFIVALLWGSGVMEASPYQQFLAGVFFVVVACISR